MNRTPDLLITNELLYQLSYTGNDEIIAFGFISKTALVSKCPTDNLAHVVAQIAFCCDACDGFARSATVGLGEFVPSV